MSGAHSWAATIGWVILAIFGGIALFGKGMAPYHPELPDFSLLLAPPSFIHPMGTDDLGRDVLSRLIIGARTSFLVAAVSVAASGLIGTALGLLSGLAGGWIDAAISQAVSVVLAFPGVLLALALSALFPPGIVVVIGVIAVVNVPVFARIARAETRRLGQEPHIEACRALGFPATYMLVRKFLPGIAPPLIVQASLLGASSIITEAYLSFLGLGVQPPVPSWGGMLRSSIGFLDQAPWLAIESGLVIFVVVLGLNLLGDALQDRMQGPMR